MAPSIYNQTAWDALTDATATGQAIEALLLEYEPEAQEEKLAWGFLINPASIDIENAASYGEVAPHATNVTSSQYSHTTGRTFTTPGMMFSLWCYKKSVRTLLDGLNKLLEPDPANNKFSPPLLRFSWGSFNVGPVSLVKYSYKITAVLGGEPTDVRDLTLTFKEQPRPLTQAEQEARAQERLAQQMETQALRGAPRMPLTERQQEEAKTRARAFLTRNIETLGADVQAAVRANNFTLEVSAESGLVTMVDSEGRRLGTISQFDGTNHKIGRQTTTIPFKSGATIGDGVIAEDGAIAPVPTATATPAATPTPAPAPTPTPTP